MDVGGVASSGGLWEVDGKLDKHTKNSRSLSPEAHSHFAAGDTSEGRRKKSVKVQSHASLLCMPQKSAENVD